MAANMPSLDERIAVLEEEVAQLKQKKRDGWDKFTVITAALIPLTIAGVGWWYSNAETEVADIRARADSKIKQAELVSTFFEPLTGETNVKRQNFAVDSLIVAAPDYGPILVKAVEKGKATTTPHWQCKPYQGGTRQDGIYNSLVLLSHMERDTIRNRKADILEFVAKVAGDSRKIKERADKLRSRLGD